MAAIIGSGSLNRLQYTMTEFRPPKNILNHLTIRLLAVNLRHVLLGVGALLLSVPALIATLYGILFCIVIVENPTSWSFQGDAPWNHLNLSHGIILFLLFIVSVIIAVQGRSLFWVFRDEEIPGDEASPALFFRVGSPEGMLLALFCLSPLAWYWGVYEISRCYALSRKRLQMAVAVFNYLNAWGGWAPYPKILSQRQGVALLYHLGLIRISRRFGKLEVRIIGK